MSEQGMLFFGTVLGVALGYIIGKDWGRRIGYAQCLEDLGINGSRKP